MFGLMLRVCHYETMGKSKKYRQAIKGARWEAFRRRVLDLRGNRCEQCANLSRPGSGVYLHVHHKHYLTLGREQPEDVEVLCNICHGLHHGVEVTPKAGRWKLPKAKKVRVKKRKSVPWSPEERERLLVEADKLIRSRQR